MRRKRKWGDSILTPEFLLRISEPAENIAEQLHIDIINRIVERMMIRIGRGEDYLLTATDKWQIEVLQDAGYLLEDIQKEIAKRTKQQESEIRDAMIDAGVRAIDYDNAIYEAAGLSPLPLMQSPYLMRLMERNYQATLGEWRNFTRTTANAAQQLFIQTVDKAYHMTASGAISYTQAVREAINEIVKDGVYVKYPSGHRDTIETATLRCVRTGIAQATGQITDARMEEMDWDIVLVSAHLGARVTDKEDYTNHFWWQGKFYSRTGRDKRFPPLSVCGVGDVQGLEGANCRHSRGPGDGEHNPFEQYDSEENCKAYEIQQRQRELERRIRNTKREVMGLKTSVDNCQDEKAKFELDMEYQRKSALLQKRNKSYNEFCKENDLKPLSDRISIAKWDRQQAAEARGAAKRYENAKSTTSELRNIKNNDIINQSKNAEILRSKINDGSITTTLNHDKQSPHMYDTREYGKSYFKDGITEDNLQQIINERSGTGTIRITKSGQIKETIDYDKDIGVAVSERFKQGSDTNRFTIHYSKSRTHAVPTRRRDEK